MLQARSDIHLKGLIASRYFLPVNIQYIQAEETRLFVSSYSIPAVFVWHNLSNVDIQLEDEQIQTGAE